MPAESVMPNGMPQSDDCLPYLREQIKMLKSIEDSDIMKEQKKQAVIVGFAGRDGSGKTTLANSLRNLTHTSTAMCSFAEDIRSIISNAFADFLDITHKNVFGGGIEPPRVGSDWIKINKPLVREMMRSLGTDVIRKKLDQDYWVLLAQYKYFYRHLKIANIDINTIQKQREQDDYYRYGDPFEKLFIFDDVRYLNELEWIRSFDKSVVFYCCSEKEKGRLEGVEYAKSLGLATREDFRPVEILWTPKTGKAFNQIVSYLYELKIMDTSKNKKLERYLQTPKARSLPY